MVWIGLLCLSLLLCSPLCVDASYKKRTMINRARNFVPLGKFQFSGTPQIRAHLVTEPNAMATQKATLFIIAYTAEQWQRVLKAPNCTNRLEQQTAAYKLRVPLDASWSDWETIGLPESTLYIVAADCYHHYAAQILDYLTEIEINGGTREEIPQTELEQLAGAQPSSNDAREAQPKSHPASEPDMVPAKEIQARTKGLLWIPIAGLALVMTTIAITQCCYGALKKKEFLFAFVLLLIVICFRCLIESFNIAEILLSSHRLLSTIHILDIIGQCLFVFHCLVILLSSITDKRVLITINAAVLLAVYICLELDFKEIVSIGLRCLLLLQVVGCYIYTLLTSAFGHSKERYLVLATFIIVLVYLIIYALHEAKLFVDLPYAFRLFDIGDIPEDFVVSLTFFLSALYSS